MEKSSVILHNTNLKPGTKKRLITTSGQAAQGRQPIDRMSIVKRIRILVSLSLFLLCTMTGCQKEDAVYTRTGLYFDTAVSVSLYGNASDKKHCEKVLDDVMEKCSFYENMLSSTVEGSDIYRINHADGEWTVVSDDTVSLLYTALNYCDLTDGRIDITIAPAKALWSFSPENDAASLPDQMRLDEALSHIDYRKVELNGNKVRLSDPQAAIDLGFIAKGFIADEIKALLIEEGIDNALIDLGGNILVLGEKPDGTPFRVGIQKPFADTGEYVTVVEASDSHGNKKSACNTVVTSGIYERYCEIGGTIYHHILDAHTGYPADTHLASVTILMNSGVNADALSTTCMVMGLDWSKEFISSLEGVDAIFILEDGTLVDTRDL